MEVYSWESIPYEAEMGPKGERLQFANKQGMNLTGYFWPAEQPKVSRRAAFPILRSKNSLGTSLLMTDSSSALPSPMHPASLPRCKHELLLVDHRPSELHIPSMQSYFCFVAEHMECGIRGGDSGNPRPRVLRALRVPCQPGYAAVCRMRSAGGPETLPFTAGPGKYKIYEGSWVQEWNKSGYSVCGLDLQGHGRSDGYKGLPWFFNSFDDLVDDVLQFVKWVVRMRVIDLLGGSV